MIYELNQEAFQYISLHDAFFQAGALTVTGTFLPIEMLRGTFVYLRMLRLLDSKTERMASGNWLHFVCFAIRTSLVWEARQKCWLQFDRDITTEEESRFIELLERLHRFESRVAVFKQLSETGLKLSDQIVLRLEETHLEFLCYTHYGRPDLIQFVD